MALHLTLHRDEISDDNDTGGRWQYEGGKVFENDKQLGYYAVTRRVASHAPGAPKTAQLTQLTMTIFFLDNRPSENITVQGFHDINSGHEIGNVRSASPSQVAYIGKHFTRVGETITIG